MNIEELVPDLELCKLMPQGEFEDSALVRHDGYNPLTKHHYTGVSERPPMTPNYYAEYPAPTLWEIMEELNRLPGVLTPTAFIQQDTWTVDCAVDASGNLVGMITEDFMHDEDIKNLDVKEAKDKNPATAALKLWLEVKGIEDEN